MDMILAIDGGGSRTRCLAIDREARVLGAGESGPSNHLQVERATVRASLSEAIDAALARAKAGPEDVACVSAGLAGVDFDGTGADEMSDLFAGLGFAGALLSGDMVIAHAGALAGRPGVLALAGTGSSILGIGADGRRVKVGGWGPVYGDEGSAYRIGQAALRAAARNFDGRGEKTALTAAILREMGISDFQKTIEIVYLKGLEPREIAALCRAAYETAEAGDPAARKIFIEAGEELAEAVAAAARRLDLTRPLISYQGSVPECCHLLRRRFIECLKTEFPLCEITPPRFSPVVGAYLLGRERVGWPADESIFHRLDQQKQEQTDDFR